MRRFGRLRHSTMPDPRGVRPRHLRLLRRRDVYQGAGNGADRKVDVPRRDVELPRYVHCDHRVSATTLLPRPR